MTSDGSAYSRFRRALHARNLNLVVAAARELPRVSLDDALHVCLLLRDDHPDRFQRAAVRWLGRFALEAHSVTIDDVIEAGDALAAMPEHPAAAMESLQAICLAHGIR
jgi:hypothetical protein